MRYSLFQRTHFSSNLFNILFNLFILAFNKNLLIGRMDDLRFGVFLTVFQSYQDDVRVIMIRLCTVQLRFLLERFPCSASPEPMTTRSASHRLTSLRYRDSFFYLSMLNKVLCCCLFFFIQYFVQNSVDPDQTPYLRRRSGLHYLQISLRH